MRQRMEERVRGGTCLNSADHQTNLAVQRKSKGENKREVDSSALSVYSVIRPGVPESGWWSW